MRKLLLLVVTICMAMAPGGDVTVTQLQFLTSILLLLLFLVAHLWIMPYRYRLVNRLEAMCQLATTITFGLLMFLTLEEHARAYITGGNPDGDPGALAKALLAIVIVLNVSVLLVLLYQAFRLVYKVARDMPVVQHWQQRVVTHLGPVVGCACLAGAAVQAQ